MTQQTLIGKTILVTGANSGIGYATAVALARMGAQVLMNARSRERGEAALAQAKQESGSNNLALLLADLSSQVEVRNLATRIAAEYPRLDVLINNAAFIPPKREVTVDGIETQFAVNHLAPFLLTNLLLEKLKASAPARIVTVSSALHTRGVIRFDDLEWTKRPYTTQGWGAYCDTKLMNIHFTTALARRLQSTNVTANCLHPGIIGTNLSRQMPKLMHNLYMALMPNAERGARTSLYLASSPEVEGVTGKYFGDNCNMIPSSQASQDMHVSEQLWEISAKRVGLAQPAYA
jgi:retinol dehydrogenase 14